MSQKGSSILSSDNPDLKYKKALMEIQKIHNANKVLKGQSEQMKAEYERQINELSLNYDHISKEYDNIKNEKAELEKFLEELQVSNTQLRKEYNNMEREVVYLNDVLSEQNTELKKVNAFKDEKGLSSLITSYEDKEINYRKEISRLEDVIKTLKVSCETLDNDLSEERRQRFKLEDLNNNLKMEITRYRELNNGLLSKNESIVASMLNRTTEGKEKYKEAESVLGELSRQLEMVKSTRLEQQSVTRATVSLDSYESVLQQKNKIETQLAKMRERISEYESRSREMFEMEEKMKRAVIKSEKLQEECNMMKSKLIMIETKDIMQGSQCDDNELKDFEEKVINNFGQNDPLISIKNSGDVSHFQLMKRYVVELKEKLSKTLIEKKQLDKRYRSLKEKAGEKVEKAIMMEEQNKLLKGKLEGFERLTERLQYELQRGMEAHDDEVSKLKVITHNILNKKSEETKIANAFIRAQLDLEMDKFEKIEKGLRQEIETLRLQISTEKIKNSDLQDNLQQTNQFLNIYKTKFNEISASNQHIDEKNQELADSSMRYEQLYREERAKNEALLGQKQMLTNRINQMSEEIGKREQLEEQWKVIEEAYDNQNRKLKGDLSQAKSQLEQLNILYKSTKKDTDDKAATSPDSKNKEQGYMITLEQNFNQQRQKCRNLEAELQSLKIRYDRANVQSQRVASLEDAINTKNDELNDIKRRSISLEKQVGVQEAQLKELKAEYDSVRKECNVLKNKLLETGQQARKSYESKDIDSKRNSQRLSEELASVTSELRDERRAGVRLQNELQNYKTEIQRMEDLIEQGKRRELNIYEELTQLKNSFQTVSDEVQRFKAELRFKNNMQEGLNAELASSQDRIYKLNQENSELRLKLQSIDNDISDLRREVSSLKIYVTEVEQYANAVVPSGNWQQQRSRENLSSFVMKVKRIIKSTQISQSTSLQRRSSQYASNPIATPDYLNYNAQPYTINFQAAKVDEQSDSPYKLNYGQADTTFRYADFK